MARPPLFEDVLNLEIGEELFIAPHAGESLDQAEARIKKQASRFRLKKLSYVVTQAENCIHIRRVHFGKNGKYWRWHAMKEGERLLVCETATARDLRKIQNSIQHLQNTRGNDKFWGWECHNGKIFVACLFDATADAESKLAKASSPAAKLERLISHGKSLRAFASFQRSEGDRNPAGLKEFLIDYAVKLDGQAAYIEEFVAAMKLRERANGKPCCDEDFADFPTELTPVGLLAPQIGQ